jgi:hypothetical protein
MTLIIDTQHNGFVRAIMLSVAIFYCYAECRYAECHYDECRDFLLLC